MGNDKSDAKCFKHYEKGCCVQDCPDKEDENETGEIHFMEGAVEEGAEDEEDLCSSF